MIPPKNETEDFLLSITGNRETLIKQTHTKPQKILDFKLTNQRETFSFEPRTSIEISWMIGLISLEICNFIFSKTEENSKIELYTDTFDEFSFEETKDEHDEILSISYITPKHLQHEKIGLRNIEAYNKLGTGKSSTDVFLLMGYATSPSQEFQPFLRSLV